MSSKPCSRRAAHVSATIHVFAEPWTGPTRSSWKSLRKALQERRSQAEFCLACADGEVISIMERAYSALTHIVVASPAQPPARKPSKSPALSRHYNASHVAQALASSVQHIQLHPHLPPPPKPHAGLGRRSWYGDQRRAGLRERSLMSDKSSVLLAMGPPKAPKRATIWSSFAGIVAGTDRWGARVEYEHWMYGG